MFDSHRRLPVIVEIHGRTVGARASLFLSVPLAVAKATGVYPATFRERVVPAEKPANPLFLFCAPGRSPGRLGDVRWSGGLSRRPNGSRTVQPPSRWRVPQTANPGRLPCQGPPYLAVARQRPQTDIDISNTPPDDAPRSSRAFCRLASFELIYQALTMYYIHTWCASKASGTGT